MPVLNEAGNIEEFTRRVLSSVGDTEIIFVDDGSADGTRDIIETLSKDNSDLKYVFNGSRLGHMGSYLAGIEMTTSDSIIIMDGDLQHPPEVLPDFIDAFQRNFDIIIGTRYLHGRFIGNRKRTRGLISRSAELILKTTVPPCRKISDPVSGFIGFKRNLIIPVNSEMKGNKLLPFLLVANREARIGYVPYRFSERVNGESKIVSGGTAYIRNFLGEVRDIRRVSAEYGTIASPQGKKLDR